MRACVHNRFTEWRVWLPSLRADWTAAGLVARELYDHTGNTGRGPASMDQFEYNNLAYDPARAVDVAQLAAVIRQQFDHDNN